MNFKIELDVPAISETEGAADGASVFSSFPKAKAALCSHFEQGVTDARSKLAAVKALRQKDARGASA